MKPIRSQTVLLFVLALIVLNLSVYAPVYRYGFVSFDDGLYVTDNPNIAGGLTWTSFRWALTTDRAGYWVPLTWLSHILDIEMFGLVAGPQHVTNVLLHVVNTLLLFGFLFRTTQTVWQSGMVAALFAVHPLHVESVAWIAERKDVLSTMFWLLTLWAYVAYVRRRSWTRYVTTTLLFAMALMAKPMVLTLPFLLLLLDFWPLRRARLDRDQWKLWLRLVAEKIPIVALTVAASLLTIVFSLTRGNVLSNLEAIPLTLRLFNGLVSYIAYIENMLWPVHLAPFYPWIALPAWQAAVSTVVLLAITLVVIWQARTRAYLLVGWLWYLGTLTPVIGLLQAGMQSRADRFTYVPLIGLFIMAAWGIPELLSGRRRQTQALAVSTAMIICMLAISARSQVRHWENRFTLWEHALNITTGNYVAHNILGMALVDESRIDEAISHYREALRIRPDYTHARNNLGIGLARQQRMDEAIAEFRTTISAGHDDAETYYNLGFALAQSGKIDEAVVNYSHALRVDPTFVAAYTKLGDALFLRGQPNEAVHQYRAALRIQPSYAEAHNNLGVVFSNQSRFDEAITQYAEAIRIRPGFAEAHNGLGATLANQGRYGESIPHFAEALRLQPSLGSARENLEIAMRLQAVESSAYRASSNISR